MPTQKINFYLDKIIIPDKNSHKGQNGKLLIIGGSNLFHAASKWSLDIASKFVDMLFYSSVPSNNKLVDESKKNFWSGIVISRTEIEDYIEEADCILIGPGMERGSDTFDKDNLNKEDLIKSLLESPPTKLEWDNNTKKIVDYLLAKYPQKKWVIDAGALQMVNPLLLNENHIITPHQKELDLLLNKIKNISPEEKLAFITKSVVVLKGKVDFIFSANSKLSIEGGNPGMTKGGTGDVLSGLVAALYCKHNNMTSAVVGSYINKKAGDFLFKKVGPFFNASDLVSVIPEVFWDKIKTRT